jgi:hypothetical protein
MDKARYSWVWLHRLFYTSAFTYFLAGRKSPLECTNLPQAIVGDSKISSHYEINKFKKYPFALKK